MVLITIIKEDNNSVVPPWLYSLVITEKFVKQLDLYGYASVVDIAEKVVDFSQTELFQELIKTVPLPKDERRYFKMPEDEVVPEI